MLMGRFIVVCMTVSIFTLACGSDKSALAPSPQTEPEAKSESNLVKAGIQGQEFTLSQGTLFVPDFFKPGSQAVDIMIHFHGAAWLAEQNFYKARKNAVLIAIHFPGFSSAYSKPFKDPQLFQAIMDEAVAALRENKIVESPRVGKICLTSFSAGYGATREILQVEQYYEKVTDVVLADSLHCGYEDGKKLPAEQMAPFTRFARDAAAGQKTLLISHSSIVPPNYASTTETANYLIEAVGGKPVAVSEPGPRQMLLISTFDKGNFHVRGYTGDKAEDHMDHFYSMAELIKATSFANAP